MTLAKDKHTAQAVAIFIAFLDHAIKEKLVTSPSKVRDALMDEAIKMVKRARDALE